MNKKGGVVTSTIMGVGALIIATIVILIVVQTLNDANLIGADLVRVNNVTNETILSSNTGIQTTTRSTETLLTAFNATLVMNRTIFGDAETTNETLIEGTHYQIFSNNASIGNLTSTYNDTFVTFTWTQTDSSTRNSLGNLTTNFTSGIDQVSLQIPTILLIVAVVFLFGALVLLIRSARTMGTQTGGSGSL